MVQSSAPPLAASVQSDRKKKLFRTEYRFWNTDFVRHSIRTRARRRPRRCFSALDFEDEDEYDDKDDYNNLRKANLNPRLDYSFFILKCSFI